MNEENKTLASINDLTDLKEYAELAHNFLHGDIGEEQGKNEYSNDKNIIQSLFDKDEYTFSDIKLQLIVIDSVYSTNASKNNDAIKEITTNFFKVFKEAKTIKKDGIITKKTIIDSFISLLDKPSNDNQIYKVFVDKYGFQKADTSKSKQAISLISKYGYFITEYNFPIYDSFVIDAYKVLKNKNKDILKKDNIDKDIINFLNKINLMTGIIWKDKEEKKYEKLDNLMWIIGKIRSGGFPLLLGREKYTKLLEELFEGYGRKPISLYSPLGFNKSPITRIVAEKLPLITLDDSLKSLIKFSCFDLKNTRGISEPYLKYKNIITDASEKIDKKIDENKDYELFEKIFIKYDTNKKEILFELFFNNKNDSLPFFVRYNTKNETINFLTKQKKKFNSKKNK